MELTIPSLRQFPQAPRSLPGPGNQPYSSIIADNAAYAAAAAQTQTQMQKPNLYSGVFGNMNANTELPSLKPADADAARFELHPSVAFWHDYAPDVADDDAPLATQLRWLARVRPARVPTAIVAQSCAVYSMSLCCRVSLSCRRSSVMLWYSDSRMASACDAGPTQARKSHLPSRSSAMDQKNAPHLPAEHSGWH